MERFTRRKRSAPGRRKGFPVALIRSLNIAVSGLKAQQFRIEVIGNNIANVDTTAFKGSRVEFSGL